MTQNDRDQTPTDVAWVAERLEQERPMAGPLELDRMKLRARSQAMRGARSQAKGSVLKSRVAIAAILMLGLFTGGTGTTLALTENGSGNAAQVQYPREAPPTDNNRVLGTQEGNQPAGGEQGGGQVLGSTQSSPSAVQSGQQVVAAQSGSDLPFTGLAAVPLIVLGLALLLTGLVLHRSARREPSGA